MKRIAKGVGIMVRIITVVTEGGGGGGFYGNRCACVVFAACNCIVSSSLRSSLCLTFSPSTELSVNFILTFPGCAQHAHFLSKRVVDVCPEMMRGGLSCLGPLNVGVLDGHWHIVRRGLVSWRIMRRGRNGRALEGQRRLERLEVRLHVRV